MNECAGKGGKTGMVYSMTGFGRWRQVTDGWEVTVEIKSVNNRYLDCAVHAGRPLACVEDRIRPRLQELGVSRGKLDVWIGVEPPGGMDGQADDARAQACLQALYRLRDRFGLRDDISVMTLVRCCPELLRPAQPEVGPDEAWALLSPVLDRAAAALLESRAREGESLRRDLCAKLETLRQQTDRLEALSSGASERYRERLTARLREVLAGLRLAPDEGRILTECAIYADKTAIDEELVRLRTHLDAMSQALRTGGAVGRRLDFLVQECNREVNTAGAKCAGSPASALVVDLKCGLEKVREQIQNLE